MRTTASCAALLLACNLSVDAVRATLKVAGSDVEVFKIQMLLCKNQLQATMLCDMTVRILMSFKQPGLASKCEQTKICGGGAWQYPRLDVRTGPVVYFESY